MGTILGINIKFNLTTQHEKKMRTFQGGRKVADFWESLDDSKRSRVEEKLGHNFVFEILMS
jgi:hypothetical protein